MIWNVNPIALSFGVFQIYWYGILFFLAIISATLTMQIIYRIEKLPSEHIYDQLFNMLIAIFIGARLAECIFYHPHYYFNNPYKIFAIWVTVRVAKKLFYTQKGVTERIQIFLVSVSSITSFFFAFRGNSRNNFVKFSFL